AKSLLRDAAVFTVSFTAKADVKLSEVLSFDSRYTAAEAYNADLELMDVELRFDTEDLQAAKLELLQNIPNPFANETLIGFNLPESMAVTISIYDLSGRVLKQIEGDFEKGYNAVSVAQDELRGSTGIMYYQLSTPKRQITKKMTLITK
ncbi:MAG: T9SS type A sorting domain-containing protein, partial [Saprospiraceae bacterium]